MDGGEREDLAVVCVVVVAMLGCWWRDGREQDACCVKSALPPLPPLRPFSRSVSGENDRRGSSQDVMHCGCE